MGDGPADLARSTAEEVGGFLKQSVADMKLSGHGTCSCVYSELSAEDIIASSILMYGQVPLHPSSTI